MLRSVLLSVECKIASYTKWASSLKENPLYAIISDFSPGDTPGTGTFYDFQTRLWMSDKNNNTDSVHPPKEKPKKPKAKGEKAPPVEKVTVKELFDRFEQEPPQDMEPCRLLYQLFQEIFLSHSADIGLIDLFNLSIAGDGTPVRTAARERKKRTCDCIKKGIKNCKCDRFFSQPDCNTGWDSLRGCYYFGYDLYMLTASDSDNDLPVFPLLNPASRHDSHGFLYNWFSFKQFLPDAVVKKWILDSAHDAMPYYKYCRKHGIIPFIDLNLEARVTIQQELDKGSSFKAIGAILEKDCTTISKEVNVK